MQIPFELESAQIRMEVDEPRGRRLPLDPEGTAVVEDEHHIEIDRSFALDPGGQIETSSDVDRIPHDAPVGERDLRGDPLDRAFGGPGEIDVPGQSAGDRRAFRDPGRERGDVDSQEDELRIDASVQGRRPFGIDPTTFPPEGERHVEAERVLRTEPGEPQPEVESTLQIERCIRVARIGDPQVGFEPGDVAPGRHRDLDPARSTAANADLVAGQRSEGSEVERVEDDDRIEPAVEGHLAVEIRAPSLTQIESRVEVDRLVERLRSDEVEPTLEIEPEGRDVHLLDAKIRREMRHHVGSPFDGDAPRSPSFQGRVAHVGLEGTQPKRIEVDDQIEEPRERNLSPDRERARLFPVRGQAALEVDGQRPLGILAGRFEREAVELPVEGTREGPIANHEARVLEDDPVEREPEAPCVLGVGCARTGKRPGGRRRAGGRVSGRHRKHEPFRRPRRDELEAAEHEALDIDLPLQERHRREPQLDRLGGEPRVLGVGDRGLEDR